MDNTKNRMRRGVHQALFKYLPGCWVDFSQSGGGANYSVHVERWNSVQLTGINSKRLLRLINQKVNEFKNTNPDDPNPTIDFSTHINEANYYVLTPKVSEEERAVVTTVNPLIFVCNKCGKVIQYTSKDDYKRNEHKRCCNERMTQLKMIRFCKCGYADGIFVPKCTTPGHGTNFMTRRGSGFDFVCQKCGQRANLPFVCPICHQKLDIKPALDSSHYIPFTLSLIDLLDKRKDEFIDNELDGKGEMVIIAHHLGLISHSDYENIIIKGKITEDDEFEDQLGKEAAELRRGGLDDATVALVLEVKRKNNPNKKICHALETITHEMTINNRDLVKSIAEEILEFDELRNSSVILSLEAAERDAEMVNDGIHPNFIESSRSMGFSNAQVCSKVPIVFSSYGYTRKERFGPGVKLHGFPQEMNKRNVYAARLETEGVLFELDKAKVLDWLLRNQIVCENDLPRSRDEKSIKLWFLDMIRIDKIQAFNPIEEDDLKGKITKHVYTLIHSISHVLIGEAAEICGLEKSSLAEYILPNIPAVFVYCSNTQGFNMGALYNAFQTQFDRWMKRAKERSNQCIFDPICINDTKACAGCLFLNEVSCQHFNKDLDRSFLCGHYDVQTQKTFHGYWEG